MRFKFILAKKQTFIVWWKWRP